MQYMENMHCRVLKGHKGGETCNTWGNLWGKLLMFQWRMLLYTTCKSDISSDDFLVLWSSEKDSKIWLFFTGKVIRTQFENCIVFTESTCMINVFVIWRRNDTMAWLASVALEFIFQIDGISGFPINNTQCWFPQLYTTKGIVAIYFTQRITDPSHGL